MLAEGSEELLGRFCGGRLIGNERFGAQSLPYIGGRPKKMLSFVQEVGVLSRLFD